VSGLIGNPFYAINIDPVLAKPHELLVSEEQWIAADTKQIRDIGPEPYLRNLLSILKGNYPKAPRRIASRDGPPGDLNRYRPRTSTTCSRSRSAQPRAGPCSLQALRAPPYRSLAGDAAARPR